MTEQKAFELLSRNLTAIYGYAFTRLNHKEKVEDLTSEIICQIVGSVKNLKNDAAFWGFAWKIAERTFCRFLKREAIAVTADQAVCADWIGVYECSFEQKYAEREEQEERIRLLRRELSLLTKTHREVCVAYYIENKSCSQIAWEQNLSLETVKYHLFKTRQLLKETNY